MGTIDVKIIVLTILTHALYITLYSVPLPCYQVNCLIKFPENGNAN